MRTAILRPGLVLAALCTAVSASAATVQISDIVQQGTMCYGSGILCETGSTISFSPLNEGLTSGGWSVNTSFTLIGTPLSGGGSGALVSSGWDGASQGSFAATLTFGLSGAPGFLMVNNSSKASTGQIQVTDIGGGNFRIASFFDVFAVLAAPGVPFLPADESGGTRFQSADFQSVPEPGTLLLLCGPAVIGYCVRKLRVTL